MSRPQSYQNRGLQGSPSNEQSPGLSPKDSFSSDESFETRDVDNDKGSDVYNFAMNGLEGRTSVGYREGLQEMDDFESLKDDPIFKRLWPKEKYEDKPTCKVCGKTFGKLKLVSKKNCKFCGGCICEDHGKKKRPNPENTSEYVRVCDTCDEKFINRTILKEFNDKLETKEKAIQEIEKRIKEQQLKIADIQKDHEELKVKKARNDKNYSEQMTFLTNDIARIKDDTKKCETENTKLTKEFNETQKKVEELDTEIEQAEAEYEKLVTEAKTLTLQIEALNQDINQMNKAIQSLEEQVNINKTYGTTAPTTDNTRITSVRRPDDTPSNRDNESVTSSVATDKLQGYKSGKVKKREENKNKNKGADNKSGNCDVGCNLF